jgi:hypothetical protein
MELSVYSRGMKKYVHTDEMLLKEVRVLTDKRNRNQTKVDWQFFTRDTCIRLKKLYPSITD